MPPGAYFIPKFTYAIGVKKKKNFWGHPKNPSKKLKKLKKRSFSGLFLRGFRFSQDEHYEALNCGSRPIEQDSKKKFHNFFPQDGSIRPFLAPKFEKKGSNFFDHLETSHKKVIQDTFVAFMNIFNFYLKHFFLSVILFEILKKLS